MKIDSTDIREFDAKQLSVEFTPPQTTVTVDMFEGALIPQNQRHIHHCPESRLRCFSEAKTEMKS